jgi:hypothetical protein
MTNKPKSRRCQMEGALERLGGSARTIRNMAAAGKIPGAAKFCGVWSFDIALLDAYVGEKERETCRNSVRLPRDAIGAKVSSGDEFKPADRTSAGHYAQTIQKLRSAAARKSAGA